jgi:2'-5' RNA ligase
VSRFALFVPFAGLAEIVDDWRERTCVTKPSHGLPPHVTLLVPAPDDVERITETLEPFAAFDVAFPRLDRFPGTLWLAPEPAEPFRELVAAFGRAFPGHPPYGGRYRNVVPHLTVAQAELDEAAADLEPWLPLQSRADCVQLAEQVQDDHWREIATFELEGA